MAQTARSGPGTAYRPHMDPGREVRRGGGLSAAATLFLLLSATLVAAAGCSEGSTPATDPTTSEPAPPETELPPVELIEDTEGRTLHVDDADWIQVIDGAPWTTVPNAVVRLSPETGKETARIKTDIGTCTAMDVGYGDLWAGDCSDRARLLRIDPGSGRLIASIPLGGGLVPEGSVAANTGGAWAIVNAPSGVRLIRIDPATNRVTGRFPVPLSAAGVRAGLGGVWVTDPGQGRLLRIDPGTGRVVARTNTGAGARFFAVGVGGVWVQNNTDGTVTRVDPKTDKVVATIPVDGGLIQGGDLAIGGGYVWARVSSTLVAQIDPATNTAVISYGPGAGSGSVAADDKLVWITAHDVDAIYRVPVVKP